MSSRLPFCGVVTMIVITALQCPYLSFKFVGNFKRETWRQSYNRNLVLKRLNYSKFLDGVVSHLRLYYTHDILNDVTRRQII